MHKNNNNTSNPFNLDRFRISQEDFGKETTKKITSARLGKPLEDEFIRVHSGEEYAFLAGIITLPRTKDSYLVSGELHGPLGGAIKLGNLFKRVLLVTAITKDGEVFLWPLNQSMENTWNISAKAVADLARKEWVRVTRNSAAQCYEPYPAQQALDEPTWPNLSFGELMELAFKNRIIESMDHPVLEALQGK